MTGEILTIVFKAVVSIIGVLALRYFIPWLKTVTTAEQRKALKQLIDDLVKAAEQLPKFKEFAQAGNAKKAQVLLWLEEQGIEITSEIEALIESTVFDLNN